MAEAGFSSDGVVSSACFLRQSLFLGLRFPLFGPPLVCFSDDGEEGAILVAVSSGFVRVSAVCSVCW